MLLLLMPNLIAEPMCLLCCRGCGCTGCGCGGGGTNPGHSPA